jgi:hypothetical protein
MPSKAERAGGSWVKGEGVVYSIKSLIIQGGGYALEKNALFGGCYRISTSFRGFVAS